jgi:hypothetical protein
METFADAIPACPWMLTSIGLLPQVPLASGQSWFFAVCVNNQVLYTILWELSLASIERFFVQNIRPRCGLLRRA